MISHFPGIDLEVGLRHESLPEVDDGKIELRAELDDSISIHLGRACHTRDTGVSTRLVPRPPEMFVDRGRGDQNDARVVGPYLWMGNDRLQVGYELIEWNVLLVRRIWQRRVVGSKENRLSRQSVRFRELKCPTINRILAWSGGGTIVGKIFSAWRVLYPLSWVSIEWV
jgi:hypothetical protein